LICSLIGLNGLSAVKTLPVTVWRFVSFRVFVSKIGKGEPTSGLEPLTSSNFELADAHTSLCHPVPLRGLSRQKTGSPWWRSTSCVPPRMIYVATRPFMQLWDLVNGNPHPLYGRPARRQVIEAGGPAETAPDDASGGCRSGPSSELVAGSRIPVDRSA
jgi:hypothetical protein